MMRLLSAAAALLCAAGLSASAQMTPVTASALNIDGVPIPAGTVTITPVDRLSAALSIVTSNGQLYGQDPLKPKGFTAIITNGAIPSGFQVPDQVASSATSANTPISYQVIVTRTTAPSKSFTFTIPSSTPVLTGSTPFALDSYKPTQTAPIAAGGLIIAATMPAHCTEPSFFQARGSNAVKVCANGVFVAMPISGQGFTSTATTDRVIDMTATGTPDTSVRPAHTVRHRTEDISLISDHDEYDAPVPLPNGFLKCVDVVGNGDCHRRWVSPELPDTSTKALVQTAPTMPTGNLAKVDPKPITFVLPYTDASGVLHTDCSVSLGAFIDPATKTATLQLTKSGGCAHAGLQSLFDSGADFGGGNLKGITQLSVKGEFSNGYGDKQIAGQLRFDSNDASGNAQAAPAVGGYCSDAGFKGDPTTGIWLFCRTSDHTWQKANQ